MRSDSDVPDGAEPSYSLGAPCDRVPQHRPLVDLADLELLEAPDPIGRHIPYSAIQVRRCFVGHEWAAMSSADGQGSGTQVPSRLGSASHERGDLIPIELTPVYTDELG